MDLVRDIRTLEELTRKPAKVLKDVRARRRPVMITADGEPEMLIIPAQLLKKKLTALKAVCDLATE